MILCGRRFKLVILPLMAIISFPSADEPQVKVLNFGTSGSLFAKNDLKKFVSRLKRLQNALGHANDVRVAQEFTTELFAEIEPRSPAAHAWIAMLEWHHQTLAEKERKLRKGLRRLNAARPFWRG